MSQCCSQVTTRLCLAAEVDLQGKGRPQMFDYRLQTHGRRQLLECCGDAFQRREIRGDQAVQVGILDLDGDFATIHEPGAVDLCERRGGHRFRLDCAKDLTDRPPELAVDDRLDGRPGMRWDAVLQTSQRLCVRRGNQVRPYRSELAGFDEGTAQRKGRVQHAGRAAAVLPLQLARSTALGAPLRAFAEDGIAGVDVGGYRGEHESTRQPAER